MHISLDGFVAGPHGEMDWIRIDPEIFDHVGKRIREGDTALYGRVTYQLMESYWPGAGSKPGASRHEIDHAAWYGSARKIVLSKTLNSQGLTNTLLLRDNLAEQLQEIKQEGTQEILVFGSPTATQALQHLNLVDGYWLFVNPVILGKGIPLFTGNTGKTNLQLMSTRVFSSGVTELSYTVVRP